jgi:non-specific serine/threonine protein kinase
VAPFTPDASVPPEPAVQVPDSASDAAAPEFIDAGLPVPVPDLPEPEPSEVLDAGAPPEPVNPEPVSPCPGAPECEWVTLPPLPAATRGHAAVEMDGTVYVFGGGSTADFLGTSSEPYASTWAYDTVAAEWTPRAFMPVGAYMLAAHRVRDRILVQTGYDGSGFVNSLLSYDPAEDTWSELSPMPSHRYIFTTGVVDDRLYVIGGIGTVDDMPQGSQDWEYKDYVQVYDVMNDTWSSAAPEPQPTGGAASCTLGSRIYVFGGDVSNTTTIYDAGTDTWSEATPPPVERNAHSCVAVGEVFYLLGGRVASGGELATVERYDPGTDTWTTLPDMPSGRQWFGAAVIDSDVYVVAGQTDSGTLLDSVWLHHTAE